MKSYLSLFLFVIIAAMLFYSCDDLVYSPKEKNYVNVPVPDVKMSINLDPVSDTLYVSGTVDLKYKINISGGTFSKAILYIDAVKVGESTNFEKYPAFHSEKFSNGKHIMRLEVWARTYSGSLADKLGSEFLVCSRSFYIFTDNHDAI
ncbi:MAG: hypothetical protein HF300_12760 [Ignavibacteria bacterium]|jgi:hypothetical protein|nr:hypothetical protein [Ignavibacteria bacterium]MCU7513427.1 hypothetical protein [Ignavibacteria bacterium]MCU7525131.1 hypothetical protein [Ignavibacteria bacterium]